ncbi:TrmH family RNA methyltransferase [Chryseobacterium sp. A301]
MLTAHTIKVIQSLDKKKFRQKYNLFLVEGNKTISELFNSDYKIKQIFSLEPNSLTQSPSYKELITEIGPTDLRKISFLKHPKDSVALVEQKDESSVLTGTKLNLVLDGLQDPGNLGTIIRLADWFGIEQIVCSEDTVDLYNPKVIQASMGSFTRVKVHYLDLPTFLEESEHIAVGTDMQGENLYEFAFPEKINLILGNEGNGIRSTLEPLLERTLTIPQFGEIRSTESLNVSMATGIILGAYFSNR